MITITDANDPRIAEFISFRDHTLNARNLFIAETEKIFLQFRATGKKIHKILTIDSFAKKYSLSGENVYIADKKLLEQIAGFKVHFEVLFLAEMIEDHSIDQLDDKIILLNGLSSPENVGSIVRSAAAFNIKSIIVDEKTCSPFLRRCIRVSMGNIFSMKSYHSTDIRQDIKNLKNMDYQILSTANIPSAISLNNFTFPKKCVLIIGSEGHGIDEDILLESNTVLKINIDPQVAHLNASNAASIFLSHMSSL
ncbi:MAG: RNA methyltransferase [Bacteriovoracaceae bacterium]|nr:RNA methyltransferase [Bacteriovoracaceae bacterium]